MPPTAWVFVATCLLLVGIYQEWQAPRQRIARVLRTTEALREGRSAPGDESVLRGLARWLTARVRPWLPTSQLDDLRQNLLWAGQPWGLTAEEVFFAKFGCALALALAARLADLGGRVNPAGPMAIAAALGYLLPERWLAARVEERTRLIRVDLPGFVHLLATALEAGLPMMEAVRRVAAEAPGLLAAELTRTVQEMAAGKPAVQAWQHLCRRTRCRELDEVVSAIIQSQAYGVGVAEQLRLHMRAIRAKKQQEATERAQAANVKMRIPTIVFIIAPTMVILLGPAAILLLRQMRGD